MYLDDHSGEHRENEYCLSIEPKCKPVGGPGGWTAEELAEDVELLPRASALREAEKLTCGDRNNDYGPPTQDFQRTADLLNALGYRRIDAADTILDILPSDVALIVAQVKVSRLMHSRGKRDSWVDLAGYAGCGYECAQEEAK